ncbi:tetratricopeptide repeat protein [Streptomyces acidicola]|uniref:tetratricopeptide repeat protein n=1 Tax=Streptomyces acidicola TaxID=2596892 RepID=UPI001883D2CC|nr:tetratricopeptide repeat protein [Streptomyces acidicola]
MSRLSREQKRELDRELDRELKPSEFPEQRSGMLPIDVRVPASGEGASVGGMPVAAHPGEPLQNTVLDYLHRIARAAGHSVLATVHDERIGYAVPLQISVDGSSCFVDEPVREGRPTPEAPAAPAGTVAPPTGEFGPAPTFAPPKEPDPTPRTTPEDDDAAPRPAPVREFAIAEVVMGALEADEAEPSLFAEPIGQINEAVQSGRIDEAAELAGLTTAQASATLGPEHPEVQWLRELSAYIAYLAGDMLGSFQLSLDLARLRHRRHDARAAYGDVQSAAAAWRAVRDPHQGLSLGRDLIEVWTELTAEAGPAADDIEQLESARTRMGRLTARAEASPAPAPGPATDTGR